MLYAWKMIEYQSKQCTGTQTIRQVKSRKTEEELDRYYTPRLEEHLYDLGRC